MNVNPSDSVNPPRPTTADPFEPNALYELKIDTDGDAVADIAYRVRFSHCNARTLDGVDGKWVQADRGVRPQQAVFLAGAENAADLAGEPANDVRFVAVFVRSLQHAGCYTPQEAKQVAETLLPYILTYDPRHPPSFPSNGRILTGHVVDVFHRILTIGKVTGDKVGPAPRSARRVPVSGSSPQLNTLHPYPNVLAKGTTDEDDGNRGGGSAIGLKHMDATGGGVGANGEHAGQ